MNTKAPTPAPVKVATSQTSNPLLNRMADMVKPVIREREAPITPRLSVGSVKADTSLDDLIPKELKIAAGEMDSNVVTNQDTPAQKYKIEKSHKKNEAPDIEQILEANSYPNEIYEQEVQKIDDIVNKVVKGEPSNTQKLVKQAQGNIDDDDLDLDSPEAIDKLIEGDFESISKSRKAQKELEKPVYAWHEKDEYKTLLSKAKIAGLKQEELDALIESASDSKVLDVSNYTKNLETEAQKYKKELDFTQKEISRLRELEKSVYFDSLPEVQETYVKPMTHHATEIKRILDLAGVSTPLAKILSAPDKIAFMDVIKEEYLTDDDLNSVTNYWRAYKDTEFKYSNAKKAAKEQTSKYANIDLPDESITGIMTESLKEFIDANDKYSYIKEALTSDLSKAPDVSELIGVAQNNFKNLVKAMANPSDFLTNPKLLNSLAKYTLDAAHNRNMESKYYATAKKVKELEEQRNKLAAAYKKLRQSGGNFGDGNNGVGYKSSVSNGHYKGDDDLKKFENFLNKKVKIDELLA